MEQTNSTLFGTSGARPERWAARAEQGPGARVGQTRRLVGGVTPPRGKKSRPLEDGTEDPRRLGPRALIR